MGAEREVIPGLGLGLDFIYRDVHQPVRAPETNRIWNRTGRGLRADRRLPQRPGRDHRRPRHAQRGAAARYLGVTFAAHKREGALKISASYTWSTPRRQRRSTTEDNACGDIPPRDIFLWGDCRDDSPPRDQGHAQLPVHALALAAACSTHYYSGSPYNRRYRNGDDRRLRRPTGRRVGINPGTNINDPGDDRELRLPDSRPSTSSCGPTCGRS